MAFVLQSDALPATNLLLKGKSGLPVFQIKVVVVVVIRPLPRDGGMAEDHGASEAEQLPRVWTRGHRETESCQRVSGIKSL